MVQSPIYISVGMHISCVWSMCYTAILCHCIDGEVEEARLHGKVIVIIIVRVVCTICTFFFYEISHYTIESHAD